MNRPAYWQLDLFMGAMIGLVVAMMRAHLSSEWETGAEIAWSVLMIVGMSLWVRANWAALQREEREQRAVAARWPLGRPATAARTLTPVQARFLAVMDQNETDDSIVVRSEQDCD
jgi:uncharacterized membrane protein